VKDPESSQPISSRSKEGIADVVPLSDGSLLFTARKGLHRPIWRMNRDGSGRLQLTSQAGQSLSLKLLPDGQGIAFTRLDESEGVRHAWRVGLQGGDLHQITDGPGENLRDIAPDGRVVLFTRDDLRRQIWRTPLEGGEAEKFLDGHLHGKPYSPGGRYLTYAVTEQIDGQSRDRFFILPAAGGEPIGRFLPPGDLSDLEWTADGNALTYVHDVAGVQNLWTQSVDGGEPLQLTHFSDGRIGNHEHSPDGSLIALERSLGEEENLWTVNSDGAAAARVTDFRDGKIFNLVWSHDSESLFFVQGEVQREVVLIEESGR
jgi:Tol biopolymer transport system component